MVKAGDIVHVRVKEVDVPRKRIGADDEVGRDRCGTAGAIAGGQRSGHAVSHVRVAEASWADAGAAAIIAHSSAGKRRARSAG